MSAFFVASVRIKDPQAFQEYSTQAAGTIAAHGGEVVLRGKAAAALAGERLADAVGIVTFPDMQTLTAWYESPEYQAIIPLRDRASDMSIVAYDAP